MKYLKTIYLLLCCTLALAACSDDDENSASGALSITTPAYTNVGYNKATLSANISGTEGVNIVKRGFCYGTASHPDIYDTTSEVRGSEISTTLTGLTPQTRYYVRAFVTLYNEEPRYSEETSFTTPAETLSDELAAYEAPTYVDDYTSFSAWSNRYDWNLANVHDPTVMKADDGYYYMYQTDASYGNAHSGNGHFHARRSKDLVNWEYLGATMSETPPTWIKEKLNAYRQEMEQLAAEKGAEYLHQMLQEVDPVSAREIHTNNVKRVIRALEFYHQNHSPISAHNQEQKEHETPYNLAYFVLNVPRELLYKRIDDRIDEMLNAGLLEEVQKLKDMGYHRGMVSMQGLGYKEILAYLDGEYPLEEAVRILKRDTRHFAKRQLTWFRREKDTIWMNKDEFDYNENMILERMLEICKDKKIL